MSAMVSYKKKESKMKYISKIFMIIVLTSLQLHPVDSIITFFVQKYPYFKMEQSKKFDPEKYSKQLKQPSFFYQTISNMQKYDSAVPGVMCLYGGNVALSDKNGQMIFKRNQQTPNIYFLVTKSVLPAYMIAPSTVHNWMLDPKESAQLYFAEFKADDQLELYYFEISQAKLPQDHNIPLNTIIFIADPKDVFIPIGATLTNLSQNLTLPNIYIKRDFCFIHNSLYTLAIKQYFRETDQESQLENLTISQIEK
jgi:hypothetical protein